MILIGLGRDVFSCSTTAVFAGSVDIMPVEMQQHHHHQQHGDVSGGQVDSKVIQYSEARAHYCNTACTATTNSKKNGSGKPWKSRRGRRRNKGDGMMVSDVSSEHYATVRYDVNGQMCGYPFAYHVPVDGYQGGLPSDPAAIYFTPNHQSFVPYYGWDSMYVQPPRQQQYTYQSCARVKNDGEPVGTGGNQENEQKKKNRNMHVSGQGQSLGECTVAPVSTLGSLWTSSALPAIEDKKDDAPDLERFLRAATPRFRLNTDPNSLKDFKLMDVWKHFERISAYGMRCSTLGGPRGASSSYFVPFLSSIQLFEPADGFEPDALSYPEGLEAWPRHMRQTFSWSAKNHVGERLPLSQQIMELVGSEKSTHVLAASKISELHPYSWFAVAWYPLYRIPEAPLTARFLTFHSMAPLWEAAMQSIADRRNISALHSDASNCMKSSDSSSSSSSGVRQSCSSSATAKGVASFLGSSRASSDSSGSQKAAAEGTTSNDNNNNTMMSDIASVTASHGSSGPPTSATLSVAEDEEELEKAASCTATTISSTASLSKIELAPVGLCWHTTAGNSSSRRRMPSENWTDTMVKVDASEHTRLSQGDSLPGSTNACVVSVSSGYVVVKKNYPLSKGGPLSWDIQQEELAEGARRLALGLGIHKQQHGTTTQTGSSEAVSSHEDICPDYQFFVSRHSQ